MRPVALKSLDRRMVTLSVEGDYVVIYIHNPEPFANDIPIARVHHTDLEEFFN